MYFIGYKIHPRQFGNLHKVEEPTEMCPDVAEDEGTDQSDHKYQCRQYVSVPASDLGNINLSELQ